MPTLAPSSPRRTPVVRANSPRAPAHDCPTPLPWRLPTRIPAARPPFRTSPPVRATSTASPPPYGLRAAVACHLVLALRNRSQRCPRSKVSPNGSSITLRRRDQNSPQIPCASTTSRIPGVTWWIGTGRRCCAMTRAILGTGRTSRPTRETPISGHTMQHSSLNAGSTSEPAACGRGCK